MGFAASSRKQFTIESGSFVQLRIHCSGVANTMQDFSYLRVLVAVLRPLDFIFFLYCFYLHFSFLTDLALYSILKYS